MNGQQSIIDNIINEAKQNSELVIKKAECDAESIIAFAREERTRLDEVFLHRARHEAQEIIASKNREVELQIRREHLSARFAAVDEVFKRAQASIEALSDEKYLDYIKKQIKEYAKDGDRVVICKNDEKRITAVFIKEIATELGISLILSDERGDFNGGVILKSLYWDSNLTICGNFRVFREEFEAELSKILTGDGNE